MIQLFTTKYGFRVKTTIEFFMGLGYKTPVQLALYKKSFTIVTRRKT